MAGNFPGLQILPEEAIIEAAKTKLYFPLFFPQRFGASAFPTVSIFLAACSVQDTNLVNYLLPCITSEVLPYLDGPFPDEVTAKAMYASRLHLLSGLYGFPGYESVVRQLCAHIFVPPNHTQVDHDVVASVFLSYLQRNCAEVAAAVLSYLPMEVDLVDFVCNSFLEACVDAWGKGNIQGGMSFLVKVVQQIAERHRAGLPSQDFVVRGLMSQTSELLALLYALGVYSGYVDLLFALDDCLDAYECKDEASVKLGIFFDEHFYQAIAVGVAVHAKESKVFDGLVLDHVAVTAWMEERGLNSTRTYRVIHSLAQSAASSATAIDESMDEMDLLIYLFALVSLRTVPVEEDELLRVMGQMRVMYPGTFFAWPELPRANLLIEVLAKHKFADCIRMLLPEGTASFPALAQTVAQQLLSMREEGAATVLRSFRTAGFLDDTLRQVASQPTSMPEILFPLLMERDAESVLYVVDIFGANSAPVLHTMLNIAHQVSKDKGSVGFVTDTLVSVWKSRPEWADMRFSVPAPEKAASRNLSVPSGVLEFVVARLPADLHFRSIDVDRLVKCALLGLDDASFTTVWDLLSSDERNRGTTSTRRGLDTWLSKVTCACSSGSVLKFRTLSRAFLGLLASDTSQTVNRLNEEIHTGLDRTASLLLFAFCAGLGCNLSYARKADVLYALWGALVPPADGSLDGQVRMNPVEYCVLGRMLQEPWKDQLRGELPYYRVAADASGRVDLLRALDESSVLDAV
jgi:hypothetical protein